MYIYNICDLICKRDHLLKKSKKHLVVVHNHTFFTECLLNYISVIANLSTFRYGTCTCTCKKYGYSTCTCKIYGYGTCTCKIYGYGTCTCKIYGYGT